MRPTYIIDSHTVLPPRYDSSLIAEKVFAADRVGERTHALATRVARRFGIEARSSVLNLDAFPSMELLDESHSPASWGKEIIEKLTENIGIEEVGHLSITYNAAPQHDALPNLACKIAQDMGLNLDSPPMELPNYGCAAGLYALESAVNYCQKHDRAAIVYVFDQCSWWAKPDLMKRNEHFSELLTSMLLFSDGAVGLLVVPERLRDQAQGTALKVDQLETHYVPGDLISMDQGCFLINKDLKNQIPEVVADQMVKPIFEKLDVDIQDIKEWSIHQGGTAILQRFGEEGILGLPPKALERSQKLFNKYGNFSAPSCLFVLDSFFHEPEADSTPGDRGAVVGFGAGYYLATMLYTRE
ncbi:MAG: 3-oxoacyl-[acyl-carrier-protein] synthase III C-terminal domain-containing protein [Bacteroidia bacterium]